MSRADVSAALHFVLFHWSINLFQLRLLHRLGVALEVWYLESSALSFWVSRYLHRWELDSALDVLTMCSCHLLENDPIKDEVCEFHGFLSSQLLLLLGIGFCVIFYTNGLGMLTLYLFS